MKVTDWKIGIRMTIGFLLVVMLMIVMAGVGITRLGVLNDETRMIVSDRAPKVNMSNTLIIELSDVAMSVRNIILMNDPQQIKAEYASIAESRKVIGETMAQLEKTVNSPKGKELLESLKEVRAKYIVALDKMLKLLNDGEKEAAQALMFSEIRPLNKAYFTALEKMKEYQSGIMEQAATSAENTYKSARVLLLGLVAAAIVLSAMIGYFITHSITQPIGEAVKIAQTVAKGDLTSKIESKSKDEAGQLLQALKEMNEGLHHVCTQVRSGTATIASATAQIAMGNMDLSSRTEQQASSLEETASSMEQLTSTVKQNGDNALQANQLAISASEIAVKGGAVVSEVVQTMGSINESSRKIVDIISVIDGIAFQTNILALNAAVEAARAGEQGRGFAVVASEVRNLAQRSASAAKEIKVLIDDSVEKVSTGSKLVDQAGTTMDEIVGSIRRVTDIMGEITAATREQVDGIEQISQAVTDMDVVTQQNAALVEEAAAAAEALQGQANNLVEVVSGFHTGDQMVAAPALTAPARRPALASPSPKRVEKLKVPSLKAQPRVALAAGGGAAEDWEQF